MAPRVALIGSEFEENLSLRYLAAAAAQEGFESALIPFNDDDREDQVLRDVLAFDPLVVGISIPFQLRARESLALAARIRASGSRAHITLGGHFATFEYENILRHYPAVDSIVRPKAKRPFASWCRRLVDGDPLGRLEGAVVRTPSGLVDGGKRKLPPLDELPFPDRRGAPREVMGVAAAPIVGSRGCYADCSFCCIYAWADNADGARYRRRSVERIVEEMRSEYVDRGVRLFIFHDDNFFVPSPEQNLKRYSRLKELLEDASMTDIALVIKCRPNDVTPELFSLLKSMGLLRAYVGIETNSDEGIVSLNRRITSDDNRRALRILRELDVYLTFNILISIPRPRSKGSSATLTSFGSVRRHPVQLLSRRGVRGHAAEGDPRAERPARRRLLRVDLSDARPARRGAVPYRDDRVLGAQFPSGRIGQPEHGNPRRQ